MLCICKHLTKYILQRYFLKVKASRHGNFFKTPYHCIKKSFSHSQLHRYAQKRTEQTRQEVKLEYEVLKKMRGMKYYKLKKHLVGHFFLFRRMDLILLLSVKTKYNQ